jgi:hypothetical protein
MARPWRPACGRWPGRRRAAPRGVIDVQVPLGWRRGPLRLRRGGIASDQAVALGASGQAVAAQHSPDPVGRQADPAPFGSGELGGDPGRAEAGMTQREGDHPLLDQRAGGIGHPRHSALPRPQDLRAVPVQLPLPAVVGRGMDPHGRQAARTLPSSAAIANTHRRKRYSRSSCVTATRPFSSTWSSRRRMRRRCALVGDVPRCRYISGIGHTSGSEEPHVSALIRPVVGIAPRDGPERESPPRRPPSPVRAC